MPRVKVAYFPDLDEYSIVDDVDIELFGGMIDYDIYEAEIPRTRLKYFYEARTRWTKAQRYLGDVVDVAKDHPGQVRRFK